MVGKKKHLNVFEWFYIFRDVNRHPKDSLSFEWTFLRMNATDLHIKICMFVQMGYFGSNSGGKLVLEREFIRPSSWKTIPIHVNGNLNVPIRGL